MSAIGPGAAALALGTLLAVGALAFVLYPLFAGTPERRRPTPRAAASPEDGGQDTAVVALREIEFDRATGKLSDDDYAQLKARYTREALVALRRESAAAAAVSAATDDPVEAALRDYLARQPRCPDCGVRPEIDAIFCSSCGRRL